MKNTQDFQTVTVKASDILAAQKIVRTSKFSGLKRQVGELEEGLALKVSVPEGTETKKFHGSVYNALKDLAKVTVLDASTLGIVRR